MTDQTPQVQATPARVTIDDVRTVLSGTDPNETNASKVRSLLGGRGSFETIQKHLGTLRAELAAAAAPPVAADAVPALPAEAAHAMWVAAWTAAQVQTMARAEKLAAERDAALVKVETLTEDVAGLVSTVDDQAGKLDQAASTVAQVQAAHLADLERLQSEGEAAAADRAQVVQELEHALESTRQELAQARAEASHAAQIAEAGRELVREEIARLTDQVGELKAALYKRAEAAPAVVNPNPVPGD